MSATVSPEWSTLRVGDEVTPLDVPLTASVIVAGAIASRDFMPVHHDRAYANEQGAPDIFMNILTSNAYVSRFITDWAGPDAKLETIDIRLGVPAMPNTILRMRGKVANLQTRETEGVVEVELAGTTDIGDHVTGRVRLTLPLSRSG